MNNSNELKLLSLQRQRRVETALVMYPTFANAVAQLTAVFETVGHVQNPGGLLITGDPGTGKSRLQTYFAKRSNPSEATGRGELPVYALRISGRPSDKEFLEHLLRGYGSCFGRMKASDLYELLRDVVRERGTKMIYIDEVNQFVEVKQDAMAARNADTLKNLHDDTHVAIVLSGIPLAERFIEDGAGRQLGSRIRRRVRFENFTYSEEYFGFLKAFDRLELIDSAVPCFSEESVAKRIFTATKGNPRDIIALLKDAVDVATMARTRTIRTEHVETACARVFGVASR